jgi:putative peptide zinc metalloprotease protein
MKTMALDLSSYEGFDREIRLDTLEKQETYLVVDGNGTHIRLTPSAYALLSAARSGVSFDRLAQILNSNARQTVSAKQLTRSYEDVVRKLQAIHRSGAEKQRLPWGFWARLRLLPRSLVRSVASRVHFLFAPWLVAVLLPAIVGSIIYCWSASLKVEFTGYTLAWSYVLFLISLLVHEFGHASASQRFGAEPSEIGFAMYLIYPALYSDVTSAWRLTRWKRVIVDVGGCYFQLIVGAIFLVLFRVMGWQPLWAAFLMIIYTCVFSLNPIFKFDGYWVAADLMGVTNLSKQPSILARHFWNVIRRVPTSPLPWSRSIIAVLVIYSFASCAVWGSFIYKLVPLFYGRILRLNAQLASLHTHLGSGAGASWVEIKGILGSTYVLAILAISVTQLSRRFVLYLHRKLITGRTSNRNQHSTIEVAIQPSVPRGPDTERRPHIFLHLSDGE